MFVNRRSLRQNARLLYKLHFLLCGVPDKKPGYAVNSYSEEVGKVRDEHVKR